jgi:predicted peptidase
MTRYGWLEFAPAGRMPKRGWPLVLFLHGSLERGDDLELVARQGLPKLARAGRKFPFLLVAPQCPRGKQWSVGALAALLDELVATRQVDPDRVVLTGISMGGEAVWSLACKDPQRFAAVVPICGTGDASKAFRLVGVPVWTFHGARDDIVPVQDTVRMVQALRAAGGEVRFTVFEEGGHDVWTRAYDDDDVTAWMVARRRGG